MNRVRLRNGPLLSGLITIFLLLSFNVFSSPVLADPIPDTDDTTEACALNGGDTDGFGLDVSEFGLDVSEFGLDVSEFGLDVSEFGLDVSEFGLDVSEFGLDVSEFGLDVSAFESAVRNMIDPANNIQGTWLPASTLTEIEGGDGFGDVTVVIVVVDDFGTHEARLPLVSDISDSDDLDRATHGYKVLSVLQFLATSPGLSDLPVDIQFQLANMAESTVDYRTNMNGTGDLTQLIRDAVVDARASIDADHIAINMSWGLIPCDAAPTPVTVTGESGDISFDLVWDFDLFTVFVEEQAVKVIEPFEVFLYDYCVEEEVVLIDGDEVTEFYVHFLYEQFDEQDGLIPYGFTEQVFDDVSYDYINQFNLYTVELIEGEPTYVPVEGDANGVQPEIFRPGFEVSAFAVEFDPFAEQSLLLEWEVSTDGVDGESYGILQFETTSYLPGESSTCSDQEIEVPNYTVAPPYETEGSGLLGFFVDQLEAELLSQSIPSFEWNQYISDFISQLIEFYLPSLVSTYDPGSNDLEDTPVAGLEALFQEYLAQSTEEGTAIIPVAAAGNHAHLFGEAPFYPASSPNVVGVSGSEGDFGPKSYFSNSGNVIAPGFSFVLGTDASGNASLLFPGTSGAAPHSAYHAALWLTYPNACDFSDGIPLKPFALLAQSNAVFTPDQDPYDCTVKPTVTAFSTDVTVDEGVPTALGTFGNGTITFEFQPSPIPATVTTQGNQWFIEAGDGPAGPVDLVATVTSPGKPTATVTVTITVANVPPTVSLTPETTTISQGQTVNLTASATDVLNDQLANYTYAFDCGAPGVIPVGSGATASCTYPTAGNYTASVDVTDKDGGVGSNTSSITVNSVLPATGMLTITKVVDGDPAPANSLFQVVIKDANNQQVGAPIQFDANGGSTDPAIQLLAGTYTIEENILPSADGWTTAYAPDNTIVVQENGNHTVTITNTYRAPVTEGTLRIMKVVEAIDPAPTNSFTVNVTREGEQVPSQWPLTGGMATEIPLDPGSYTIEEVFPGEGWTVEYSTQSVEIVAGQVTDVEIKNTYRQPVAQCPFDVSFSGLSSPIVRGETAFIEAVVAGEVDRVDFVLKLGEIVVDTHTEHEVPYDYRGAGGWSTTAFTPGVYTLTATAYQGDLPCGEVTATVEIIIPVPPPALDCPAGGTLIPLVTDLTKLRSTNPSEFHTSAILPETAGTESYIRVISANGHPELGCPDSGHPWCGQNQQFESLNVFANGAVVGNVPDHGPGMDDQFMAFSLSIPAELPSGQVPFSFVHAFAGQVSGIESVEFTAGLCLIAPPPDDDRDNVPDDGTDQCLDTPASVPVNDQGCAESQLDDDGDGVTNDMDECPNTSGEVADQDGCGPSQIDTDGDGVTDLTPDECPNTPEGLTVAPNGCEDFQITVTNTIDCQVTGAFGGVPYSLAFDETVTLTVTGGLNVLVTFIPDAVCNITSGQRAFDIQQDDDFFIFLVNGTTDNDEAAQPVQLPSADMNSQ